VDSIVYPDSAMARALCIFFTSKKSLNWKKTTKKPTSSNFGLLRFFSSLLWCLNSLCSDLIVYAIRSSFESKRAMVWNYGKPIISGNKIISCFEVEMNVDICRTSNYLALTLLSVRILFTNQSARSVSGSEPGLFSRSSGKYQEVLLLQNSMLKPQKQEAQRLSLFQNT